MNSVSLWESAPVSEYRDAGIRPLAVEKQIGMAELKFLGPQTNAFLAATKPLAVLAMPFEWSEAKGCPDPTPPPCAVVSVAKNLLRSRFSLLRAQP